MNELMDYLFFCYTAEIVHPTRDSTVHNNTIYINAKTRAVHSPRAKKKESKHTETQYKLKSVSFIKIFHFCQHLPASFSDRHGQHKKAFSLSISFTSHKSNPVLLCRHHILFSHVDIKPYLGHTGICAD